MGIGISLVLIAIGAILAYAVEVQLQGVNLTTVGVMIIGGIGVVLSLLFWSTFGSARIQRRIHGGEAPDGRVVEERYDRI